MNYQAKCTSFTSRGRRDAKRRYTGLSDVFCGPYYRKALSLVTCSGFYIYSICIHIFLSLLSYQQSLNSKEGNSTLLQYSCLENPMDRGAWWAAVHRVIRSQTRLSDFTFTFHFHALEKAMASHSSVLAWRIPGTGEPGGLPSMGSHRVRHD